MKIHIRKRALKGGMQSLYFDYHHNGRKREPLNLNVYAKPRTPGERHHNQETMRLAEAKKARLLLTIQSGGELFAKPDTDFIDWMQDYYNRYQKKDIRMIQIAIRKFKLFLKTKGRDTITGYQLEVTMCEDYAEWLKADGYGEGPSSTFSRFKKMLKRAKQEKVITIDLSDIKVHWKHDSSIRKVILTPQEIAQLYVTPCKSDVVKRAFIFCCYTGMPWKEVKEFRWEHVNNGIVIFDRAKTGRQMEIPLNKTSLDMMGEHEETGYVFNLSSYEYSTRVLRQWAQKAGLQRIPTWHSARHSYATNLLDMGVDIRVIARGLNHSEGSGLKHVMRYAHVRDKHLKDAVDKLPGLPPAE